MYNVAIIVIDTLREDHAQGLEALRQLGFVQYHGVAPAPWTLPSHISMITGLMPSQHGVHEAPESDNNKLGRLARLKMHKYNRGIIGELERLGYHTAIFTANPYLTPYFGFNARTYYVSFNPEIDIDRTVFYKIKYMIKKKYFGELINRTMRFLLWGPADKGGRKIYRYLSEISLQNPYVLLINIMEAHEPYRRIWDITNIWNIYIKTILDGKCPREAHSLVKQYSKFANKAIRIAIKMAQNLADDKTLIIVTSDHGQGLCDPGFLHGYWLYDGLVRVPLWVKYPKGVDPPPQRGKYISLAEIPALIRYVVVGEKTFLGTNNVCSESFGIGVVPPPEHRKGIFLPPDTVYEYRKRCID